MRKTRTQAASAAKPARTVPGFFITDTAHHRIKRCANLCEMLSGLTDTDVSLARYTPQGIAAIADFIADDLRLTAHTAATTTGPEPAHESDLGTAQDAEECALLALWRAATPTQRQAIARIANANTRAAAAA